MSMLSEMWAAWSKSISSLPIGGFLQALSLPLSMLVAWLTFRAGSSNLRYSLVVSDVTAQIKEFSASCREVSQKIERHYLGDYEAGFTAGAAKESRNQILSAIKALDDKRAVLNVFLSKRKAIEIQTRFDQWQNLALGDNFPVTRKEDRCKDYEKPVIDLRRAQSELDRYLAALRKSCIDDGWRLRKTIR
jgi:hypothetical protein